MAEIEDMAGVRAVAFKDASDFAANVLRRCVECDRIEVHFTVSAIENFETPFFQKSYYRVTKNRMDLIMLSDDTTA